MSDAPAGLDAAVDVTVGRHRVEVDLHVDAGSTVAVVGRNGAGKSTLLRALAGLLPLDRGRVSLGGVVLDEPGAGRWVPPEQRSIGVVFQEHRLLPHLSAVDNVAFGLRCRGWAKARARAEARGWLDRVGLADRADARPDELSGGQAQRVAIVRAMVLQPELLLLDEPLAALDASVRPALRRELQEHLAGHEGVRVLVTHDPVDAAALAGRVVVLDAGRAVQEGPPAELALRPRTPYVADLMGMNLLRGTGRAGGPVAVDGGGELWVASPDEDGPVGPVLLTVRPSAVTLHRTRPEGSARNVWPATIEALDPEPGRVRASLVGEPSLVAEITPAAVVDLALAPGQHVWAALKATEVVATPA